MVHVFDPHPRPTLPVAGLDKVFPVRRIFCVGRNYADHGIEMGGDPSREEPFFFTKPADAVWHGEGEVLFPPKTKDLHHEAELVVAIGRGGTDIRPYQALDHVFGYAVGVDLTRRDLQAEAKERGRPWDMSKGFDHSAPMSAIVRVETLGHHESGRLWLKVNDEIRQDGDISQQIWSVPDIIAKLSQFVELKSGDLIMTGTPAGVGPLQKGDHVEAGIDNIGEVAFTLGDG